MSSEAGSSVRECPFPDCNWSYEWGGTFHGDEITADHKYQRHYGKEHAGRVLIQVTLESEQQLGPRDPKDIRENFLERWEEKPGMDVAHVRTEVLEEADDHSALGDDDGE